MRAAAFLLALAALALAPMLAAAPAHAQESGTVTARAELIPGVTPIRVVPAPFDPEEMTFATVGIPISTAGDKMCRYYMFSDERFGDAPDMRVLEVDEFGLTAADFLSSQIQPTMLGCQALGTANTADFFVICGTGRDVSVTTSFTRAALPGIRFDAEDVRIHDSKSLIQVKALSAGASTTQSCLEIEDEDGGFLVSVGGVLYVGPDAAPGADIAVGTVTLEASY